MNQNTETPQAVEHPETTTGRLSQSAVTDRVTHIRAQPGWRMINVRELWEFRDLIYFLTRRDIKVRYAQSILGVAWALIQPLFFMSVFMVIFGRLVRVSSDGVPYAIFSYAGLVPWVYFSNALIDATNSSIVNGGMLTKAYFPRLVMPLTPVLAKLFDFGIALLLLFGLMAWFRMAPTAWALMLPLLILLMALTAAGMGMWLSALAIQYRDVKYAMQFTTQVLMYAAPVVYPVSLIPDRYRLLYGLNPIAGVIEGFRASLLGTTSMPWDLLVVGTLSAVFIAMSGALFFRRMERVFADVI